MEIIRIKNNDYKMQVSSLDATIGAYDGIHQGHIAVIDELVNKKISKYTAVITFESHPDIFLQKRNDDGVIETIEEKAEIFGKLGVDYLIVLDNDFLNYSYQDFNDFLKNLKVIRIVVGEDFVYGKGLGGSPHTLRRNFIVKTVDLVKNDDEKLSSTSVRNALKLGDIEFVNKILNEEFSISGIAQKGSDEDSLLGYKTVTLECGEKYHELRYGVYKVNVVINDKEYLGISNFGVNPTVNKLDVPRLELFVFDYENDISNKQVKVKFIKFIRDEQQFTNIEELKKQIEEDIKIIGE